MPDLNIPEQYYQSQPTSAPAAPAPKTLNIPEQYYPGTQEHTSRMEALGNGLQMGIDTVGSTLQKLVATGFPSSWKQYSENVNKGTVPGVSKGAVGSDAQDIQNKFVKESQDYQTNPSTNAHPYIAGAGNIAGNLLATAPLIAAGGSAVGGLMGGAAADAGLNATAQGVAKLGGSVLGNMVSGGAQGALMNTQGQGTDVINQGGMQNGALLGGALTAAGAGIGKALNMGSQISDLQASKDALNAVGAQSKRFASDVEGGVNKWFANKILGGLPSIFGNTAARTAQGTSVANDFANYLGALAPGAADLSRTKIANILLQHQDEFTKVIQNTDVSQLSPEAQKVMQGVLNTAKTTFNPNTNPSIVPAIQEMNENQVNMGKFMKWVLNPQTSSTDIQSVSKIIGKQGTDEIAKSGLIQMFQGALDNKTGTAVLNLPKFFNGYTSLPNTAQHYIYGDTMDALKGLNQVAQDYFTAKQTTPISKALGLTTGLGATAAIGGAGYSAYKHPDGAIATGIGLGALALISRNAPIKSLLVGLNQATNNPEASQYLLKKASDQLIRAGVIINQNPDGTFTIDMRPQQ